MAFVREHRDYFSTHSLVGTGTTGWLIQEKTGLEIECVKSGPLGGDQQIGGQIAAGVVDMVIFFRDPLTAQAHEPDISALIRICDVYNGPVATNLGTANILIKGCTSSG